MDTTKAARERAVRHTCRDLLGIDCVLPLNHDGTHLSRHKRDLARPSLDNTTETVDVLTTADRDRTWRDRFGRRVWWHEGAHRWVSQSELTAAGDEPTTVEDLRELGPFTLAA